MTTKKHIAFVASHPGYDILNRKSAIDSIVYSILYSIKDEFRITVNGVLFIDLLENSNSLKADEQIFTNLSKANWLAKFIPFRVKERIRVIKQKKFASSVLEKYKLDKPDIVFELLLRGSDLGARLAIIANAPLVIYYDSPLSYQYSELFQKKAPAFYIKNEINSLCRATEIICYSLPVADYIRKITDNKIIANINFFQTLDYTRLTTSTKKKPNDILVIGYIGSFMGWHRVDMLINAFFKLREEGIPVKLLLVGGGETYKESHALANSNEKFKDDIKFTGFIDGDNLEEKKKSIDIGVMPGSNWYGIPTKVFEYGAMQIASIAPETPTISDIFSNRKNILLFRNNDAEDFLFKLRELVLNIELRNNIAIELNKKVQHHHNITSAREFYLNLFRKIKNKHAI